MKKILFNTIICLMGFLLILLVSTMAVTKFKPLFYYSIDKFNLVESTNYNEDEMKENYSYVIDYLFDSDDEKFSLPSIKYSDQGASHFEDVKDLYILGNNVIVYLVGGIIVLGFIYYKIFRHHSYLKYLGATAILAPISVSLIVSVNFNKYFNLFHKVFFNNDDWIFDPLTDPIINILPEGFFALCGIAIILVTMFLGFILLLAYYATKRNIRYTKATIE